MQQASTRPAMTPAAAEALIIGLNNHVISGSLIARLSVRTPDASYMSADLMGQIENPMMRASLMCLAADLILDAEGVSVEGKACHETDAAVINIHLNMPTGEVDMDTFQDQVARTDLDAAAEALLTLPDSDLQAALARIVDASKALCVINPDAVSHLRNKGIAAVATSAINMMEDGQAFRFSSIVFLSGLPDRMTVARMLILKQAEMDGDEAKRRLSLESAGKDLGPVPIELIARPEPASVDF